MSDFQDEVIRMIDDCEKRESKLTDWECNFIQSLSEKIEQYPLSEKQLEKLEKIWERVTAI